MSETLVEAIKDVRSEGVDNQRRLAHNIFCDDVGKLEPYNNEAFLRMVSLASYYINIHKRRCRCQIVLDSNSGG